MGKWAKRLRGAWDALRGDGEEFTLGSPAATALLNHLRGGGLSKLWSWAQKPLRAADAEIRSNLRGLRSKSRELTWTWGYGARWLYLLVENVLGETGFQLQSQVKRTAEDGTERADLETQREIEQGWKAWGKVGVCTADGRLSWHGVEKLLLRSWGGDGEALLRLYPGFDNAWGFAVEVLDPDQLDDDFNRLASPGVNEVRMGVEVDEWNRPVAYHVWRKHPGSRMIGALEKRERVRVPADQVIHLYEPWRAGQTRGLPRLTPVLFDSHLLSGLEEAELTSSRIAAAKMGVLEVDPEYQLDPQAITGEAGTVEIEVSPGGFTELPAGFKLTAWDPQHPNGSFPDFHKAILRAIASGAHTGYNALANDLEGVNYTSLRQDSLLSRVTYRMMQRWLWEQLHDRVFSVWLRQALMAGQLELEGFRTAPYEAHEWRPRGWEWVDPVKEVQAEILAIRAGLESRTRAVGRRGGDFEEILREIARENELADELGLFLDTSLEDAPSPNGPSGDEGSGANQGGGRSRPWGASRTNGRSSSAPPRVREPQEAARDLELRELLIEALRGPNNGGPDGE